MAVAVDERLDLREKLSTALCVERDDDAFVGITIGSFGSDFLALLPQVIQRAFQVSARFLQCLLAIHHSGAGGFTQFAYIFC